MANPMNDIVEKENQEVFIDRLLAQRNLYSKAKCFSGALLILCILVPVLLSFVKCFCPDLCYISQIVVVYGVVATILRILLKDTTDCYQGLAARVQQLFDTELFDLEWNKPLCGEKPLAEQIYKYSRKGKRDKLANWYGEIVAELPKSTGSLVCMRTNVTYDKGLRKRYFICCVLVFFIAALSVIVLGLVNNTGLWDAFLYGLVPLMPIVTWFIDVFKQHCKSIKVLDNLYALIISALETAGGGNEVSNEALTEIQNFIYLHRKSSYLVPDCVYNLFRLKSEGEAQYSAQRVCEEYRLLNVS